MLADSNPKLIARFARFTRRHSARRKPVARFELTLLEGRTLLSGDAVAGSRAATTGLIHVLDRPAFPGHGQVAEHGPRLHAGARLASRGPQLPSSVVPLTPLDRLGYWDPATKQFTPVKQNDPRLAGKDVYVIVHGWAPGYENYVQRYAQLTGYQLLWWDTYPGQKSIPGRPGYDAAAARGSAPASPWLLKGQSGYGVKVATTGLVQSIQASDPKAVVLAYSWIDESATGYLEANRSEANTALNGERLATALNQALGAANKFTGKLQLLGHSHGSKVVTVAAVALGETPGAVKANQLTILDSPETFTANYGSLISEFQATNNDWYFLESLNINRNGATGTYVDNYISQFDAPFDGISYPGSNANLKQVVDVNLKAWPAFPNPSDEHSYAANWYAGSAEPGLTFGARVGREWSPLLPGNSGPSNPPQNLAPYYLQGWKLINFNQRRQFQLTPQASGPAFHPAFNTINLAGAPVPGVTVKNAPSGATVSLKQTGGTVKSYQATFTGASNGVNGATFQYQFQNPAPGDWLTILVNGDVMFIMHGALVGTQKNPGTLSFGNVDGGETNTITFQLTSTKPNSSSGVTISNLQQFANS
jgi:hypothetical protein